MSNTLVPGVGNTTTTRPVRGSAKPGGSSTGGVSLTQGVGGGTSGIPSNTNLDQATIAIVDQGGGDPLGLGSIFTLGKAMTVAQRVRAVATMSAAQRAALAQVLVTHGLLSAKDANNPSIGVLQTGLTNGFRYAAESNATSLEAFLTTNATSAPVSSANDITTTAVPRVGQTTYSAADIQDTVDATAQKIIGRKATADEMNGILSILNSAEGAKAQAQVSADVADQTAQAQANAQKGVTTYSGAGGTLAQGDVVSGGMNAFLSAIRQHESGGNYQANSGDGAYGAYQFIPSTWNNAAKQAGYGQYANGRADKAPPQVQDAVALSMASGYARQFNNNYNMMARAWFDPAYVNQPNFAPPGNNGLTIGQYGQDIVNLMGRGGGTGQASTAFTSPVGTGLTQGRTDQGVDFSGSGPLYAVDSGTIISTNNPGWPGGAFIALKLDNPVDAQHSVVYYAENIQAGVKVGQKVKAGQQIGTATGQANSRGNGIEIGWADPKSIGRALAASEGGGYSEGQATAEGTSFLNMINGQGNQPGTATGKVAIAPAPQVSMLPNTPSASEATANYYETQKPGLYQTNNLLDVFQMIQSKLGSPDSSSNLHVLNAPVAMK